MDIQSLQGRFDAEVQKLWPEIAAMSDDFAAHPEVSGEEFRTSAVIAEVLGKAGFDVQYPFLDLPTAFMARRTAGDGTGAKVALLVEYDALPGIGHGCGHNLHGSMSVLAGLGLLPLMDELQGELRVVGTPSEETNGAKVVMAEKGVFDDCDFAIMIHCSAGRTIVKYRALAMDALEFTFKGLPAHAAAAPWEGRNALNGLQLFFHAIDMLRQHVKQEVRMHGIYHDGGAAPNVVPEKASGRFYFRAPKRFYLNSVVDQVLKCAQGAAMATNTEVTWRNFEASFMDLLPNRAAEELLTGICEDFGLTVLELDGFLGSSDVGDVSYRCPALQVAMDFTGRPITQHSKEFANATVTETGHEALLRGAKILGRAAMAVFTDPSLRERMRQDFEAERKKATQ